jgi:hypothetical protein
MAPLRVNSLVTLAAIMALAVAGTTGAFADSDLRVTRSLNGTMITACTTLNQYNLAIRSAVSITLINNNDGGGCFSSSNCGNGQYGGDYALSISGRAVDVYYAGDHACPSAANYQYTLGIIPDNGDGFNSFLNPRPYNVGFFQPKTQIANNWVLYSVTVTGTVCQTVYTCNDANVSVPAIKVKVEEITYDHDLPQTTAADKAEAPPASASRRVVGIKVVPEDHYTVTIKYH